MNFTLRKWRLSDAKDLAAALNNEKILNNLRDGLPFPYTERDGAEYISAMLAADENDCFAYAITVDDRAIGSIGAFRQNNIHRQTAYRLRLLDTALERLRKDDETMKYDVTLKTFPARYAATVRMRIPSYEMEGMLWNTLVKETAPLDPVPDDPCYCSAVFHDKEFKESDVDVEVQKTVKGQYPDTDHVQFKTLPEVTVASATCRGSYEQMNDIMAAVANWVRDNGYEFEGPAFNIYHVSPYETQDPSEFVTEVCYPVRRK